MLNRLANLGQSLLYRVKCLDGCSAEELDKIDCVLIECTRSDGATRAAHRCVLEVGSDYFAQEISKLRVLRESRNQSHSIVNSLRLDASVDLVDILLEYLYTREPAQITGKIAIEMYATSKRYGLNEVASQVEEFFQLNIASCIDDEHFWDSSNFAIDIDFLSCAFENVRLDDSVKIKLMQRVKEWSASDTDKTRTAWKLCESLLSRPTTSPVAATRARPQDTTMALVGVRNVKNPEEKDWVIVSMRAATVIWSGRFSDCSPIHNWKSVVVNGKLYIPECTNIYVRRLRSNELVREIMSSNENHIYGVRVFNGEVFFYTRDEIYALDAQGGSCTKIAQVDGDLDSGLTILRRDDNEFSIAMRNVQKSEVRALTFIKGHSLLTPRVLKLQTLPKDMTLIGSHEGMLYFLHSKVTFFYVAFRWDAEVKRHPVDNCHKLIDWYICNGVLYLVYFAADAHHVEYICGIDLSSDTVVFKKSCPQLGLREAFWMIPVVGPLPDGSNKQSTNV